MTIATLKRSDPVLENGKMSRRFANWIETATSLLRSAQTGSNYGLQIDGAISMLERSADPDEPEEGVCVIWMSDGTEKGNDGDVLIASKTGGVTRYATLFDHSAGTVW